MNKAAVTALVAGMTVAFAAFAQTDASRPSTGAPELSTAAADARIAGPPVSDAGSYTEAEARDRLPAPGDTDIGALRRDPDSVWRGEAMANGMPIDAPPDGQGNSVHD
jgi:hypothetical protein